ncbi:MAG: nucleotide exchange factor GrpE [Anaerolineaceae bacterium]
MKEPKTQHTHHEDKEEIEEKVEEVEEQAVENTITLGLEDLQKEYAQLKAQSDEYLDSLQRERASFANYKKRIDLDNVLVYDNALAEQVKIFLPVVDDLERALKNKPNNSALVPWVNGIELILQKLLKTLESKGVKPIEVKPGDNFDPTFQEAVTHEENPDYSDGQVIEAVQTGYKLKDRIIRPVLVRVAK